VSSAAREQPLLMPAAPGRRDNGTMVNSNAGWGGGVGGAPAPARPLPLRAQRARVVLRPLGWAALLVAAVSLLLAVVAFPYVEIWKLVRGSAGAEATVEAGDVEQVRLGAGTWVLWAVDSGSTAGCPPDADGCGIGTVIPEIVVRDEDGQALAYDTPSVGSSSVGIGDSVSASQALHEFELPEAQTVEIVVGEGAVDHIAVTESPDLDGSSFRVSIVAAVVFALALLLRIGIAVLRLLLRMRIVPHA
jgi:hypothetical protein